MRGHNRGIRRLAAALAVLLMTMSAAPALAETFSAIVTAKSMAVYGEAAMSRKLGALEKDTVVRVSGYTNTIAKISYDGHVGYASVSDLKRVDDVAKKAVLNAAAPVYQTPETEGKSVMAPQGTRLYVLAVTGEWAQVEREGYVGYVKTEVLAKVDDDWNTPEASAAPTDAAITQQNGITVREYSAVTVEDTKVYKKASAKAKAQGTLKTGIQVTVKATSSDGWAFIELNGKHGYCKLSSLREGVAEDYTPAPVAADTANDKVATVTDKTLNVYQTASTDGKKLGTLKKGRTVNVIKTRDGWAYIELNGNYGFCQLKGLTIAEDQQDVPAGYKKGEFTATVVTRDARVYAAPNTSAENVSVKLGAEVQVVAYNSAWACVKQDASYGFISVKALSKAEYAPISGDGTDLQTLLKALLSGGYYDAEPTTSYNAAAIAAIKRFQNACGLEETGVADQAMLRIVYSGYAPVSGLLYKSLSSGEKGDSVSRVQARLYALGYLTKTASLDGEYGSTTVAAVKLFQSASGIEATGTADTATLKALYSTEAKKLPSGTKAADATSAASSSSSSSSTYLDSVPAGLASTTSAYSDALSVAEKLEYAIYLCQGKLGRPYVYGATGPDKFDCSGLTTWAFKAIGVALKRSAYAQGYDEDYEKIEGAANLRRGDIVFFNTISDSDLSDHAGMYIGDGYFIHASSGAHKVVVSNLTTGFYGRVFSWGRRILK